MASSGLALPPGARLVSAPAAGLALPPGARLVSGGGSAFEQSGAYVMPEGSAGKRAAGGLWDYTLGGLGKLIVGVADLARQGATPGAYDPSSPGVQLIQGIIESHYDQAVKAKQSRDKGELLEAARHALAAVVPFLGPAAGAIGDDLVGEEPEFDKFGNVTKPGRAPNLARALGSTVGLIGSIAAPEGVKVAAPKVRLSLPRAGFRSRLNPVEQEAVDFLQANEVPLNAGTITGNKFLKGAQAIAQNQPLGAGVAAKATRATTEGLQRVAGELADEAYPEPVSPESAGAGVPRALGTKIENLGLEEDAAYARAWEGRNDPRFTYEMEVRTRQEPVLDSEGKPTGATRPAAVKQPVNMPVDVRDIKAQLQPVFDEMQWMPASDRASSAGYQAVKNILEGDDFIPAWQAEKGLSGLKAMARTTNKTGVRNTSQGIGASIIPDLQEQIDAAVAHTGEEALRGLQRGRATHASRMEIKDLAEQLRMEPVQAFGQLTWRNDTGIDFLRKVGEHAPDELPKIGRAYIEQLFDQATREGGFAKSRTILNRWQELGPETRKLLYPNAGLRASLDNFFKGAAMVAENPNPSGTAVVGSLIPGGLLAIQNPVSGGAWLLGGYAAANLLFSPRGVALLTKGLRPAANAGEAAMRASQILEMAGDGARPVSQAELGAMRRGTRAPGGLDEQVPTASGPGGAPGGPGGGTAGNSGGGSAVGGGGGGGNPPGWRGSGAPGQGAGATAAEQGRLQFNARMGGFTEEQRDLGRAGQMTTLRYSNVPESELSIVTRPDGTRAVATFFLPEDYRGLGLGQQLYLKALEGGPIEMKAAGSENLTEAALRVRDALVRKNLAHITTDEAGRQYLNAGRAPAGGGTVPPGVENAETGTNTGGVGEGRSLPGSYSSGGSQVAGKATIVRVPGSTGPAAERYTARYEVRELSELQPSHNGITFSPNPKYALKNNRDYAAAENQRKVRDWSTPDGFEPDYHITNNPDATNGPPVIDGEGNGLGGNGRLNIMQRVYAYNPKGAAAYRALLMERAREFGIDPAQIEGMNQPVLVRRVSDADLMDAAAKARAIGNFNVKGTAELRPNEAAIADSRRVSEATLEDLGDRLDAIGPEATLAEVMEGDKGPEILQNLIRDGVISPQEQAKYVFNERLTPAAKDRIGKLMLGRFFRDPDQLERAPASIRGKLERMAAPLAKVEGDPAWSLTQDLQEALDLLSDARAHDMRNLDEFVRQGSVLGEQAYTPNAIALAKALDQVKPTVLTKAAREYAQDASFAAEGSGLFGEPPTPAESFAETLGKTVENPKREGQRGSWSNRRLRSSWAGEKESNIFRDLWGIAEGKGRHVKWAIDPSNGRVVLSPSTTDPRGLPFDHYNWFDSIGLPSVGDAADKVRRGDAVIAPGGKILLADQGDMPLQEWVEVYGTPKGYLGPMSNDQHRAVMRAIRARFSSAK